jgi:hypothetical protein
MAGIYEKKADGDYLKRVVLHWHVIIFDRIFIEMDKE